MTTLKMAGALLATSLLGPGGYFFGELAGGSIETALEKALSEESLKKLGDVLPGLGFNLLAPRIEKLAAGTGDEFNSQLRRAVAHSIRCTLAEAEKAILAQFPGREGPIKSLLKCWQMVLRNAAKPRREAEYKFLTLLFPRGDRDLLETLQSERKIQQDGNVWGSFYDDGLSIVAKTELGEEMQVTLQSLRATVCEILATKLPGQFARVFSETEFSAAWVGFQRVMLEAIREEVTMARWENIAQGQATRHLLAKILASNRSLTTFARKTSKLLRSTSGAIGEMARCLGKNTEQLSLNTRQMSEYNRQLEKVISIISGSSGLGQSAEARFGLMGGRVDYLRSEFWGRGWLFERISDFQRRHSATGGYIALRGVPGSGKSAIAAMLALMDNALLHMFVHGSLNSDFASMCMDLANQAAARGMDAAALLHARHELFFPALVAELAKRNSRGAHSTIVIDALDEADPAVLKVGRTIMGLPEKLGRGVFVVLTSRDTTESDRLISQIQRQGTPLLQIELSEEANHNDQDALEYIASCMEEPEVIAYLQRQNLKPKAFTTALLEKSQGNFLYLRYVLPQIKNGIFSGTILTALPSGLHRFYEKLWEAMRADAGGADLGWKMAVVAVLGTLHQAFSAAEIYGLIKCIPAAMAEALPDLTLQRTITEATLEDLENAIEELRQYLLRTRRAQGELEVRIYHRHFAEYLKEHCLRRPVDYLEMIGLASYSWHGPHTC